MSYHHVDNIISGVVVQQFGVKMLSIIKCFPPRHCVEVILHITIFIILAYQPFAFSLSLLRIILQEQKKPNFVVTNKMRKDDFHQTVLLHHHLNHYHSAEEKKQNCQKKKKKKKMTSRTF